eukprot:Gb_03341 [translate_table: standard]
MDDYPKGTVTPLASAFSVEEAEKAAKRVEESLEIPRKELQKLEEFLEDNRKLTKLVQKLPDEISYNIMVPFGKAAFFPGRMIHTNELLVLLGEGYYAERTAKQTMEVLHRRTKTLESQIEGVKAVMDDLRAEASFFTSTAAEAAAGVMEIREEYVEKSLSKEQPDSGKDSSSAKAESSATLRAQMIDISPSTEDKEYDQIMARLSELEQAEAEADAEAEGNGSSSEESEDTYNSGLRMSASQYDRMHDEESEDDEVENQPKISLDSGKGKKVAETTDMEHPTSKATFGQAPGDRATIRSPADFLKFEEWKTESIQKEDASRSKVSFHEYSAGPSSVEATKPGKEIVKSSGFDESYKRVSSAKTQSNEEHAMGNQYQRKTSSSVVSKDDVVQYDHERKADSRKAFTGLVVEHGTSDVSNTVKGPDSSQQAESKPSRPVSRFKMQKSSR